MSLVPVLLAVLAVLVPAVPADAAERSVADVCSTDFLAGARASTSVELQHGDRTYTKVTTELRVDVPADWPLAQDLLLSERSRRYIQATRCLIRSPGNVQRWSEWRTGRPEVTTHGDRVKIVDRAHTWVDHYRQHIDIGTWRVRAGADRWTVTLAVPRPLAGARWERITVDPGPQGAVTAAPRPGLGEGDSALVWQPQETEKQKPEKDKSGRKKQPGESQQDAKSSETRPAPRVTVSLEPSWQRSWAAQGDRLIAATLDRIGGLLWVSAIAVVLLAAARRYRRRSGTPTEDQRRSRRNLVAWAFVSIALFTLTRLDDLITRRLQRSGSGLSWDEQILLGHGLAFAVVAVLLGFARPNGRIWTGVAVLALPPSAFVVVLSTTAVFHSDDSPPAALAMALASSSLLALTLLGLVAAAWRLATDGGLLPPSRRYSGNRRVLQIRWAAPAIGAASVAVILCAVLAKERNWQRATWLRDHSSAVYAADHRWEILWEIVYSAANVQDWLIGYAWMITAVAVLAALRSWRAPSSVSPFDDTADRLLLLVFFPLAVGMDVGYALENALAASVAVPLHMLALLGAATLLAQRAVLAQPFERSGRLLATATVPADRRALLRKARAYREIHAELRRLDQGLFGDVPPKRKDLERELNELHDWPASTVGGTSTGPDRLPAKVSVVDAALALGPRDDWWANGSRGARFAVVPGLPASVLTTWLAGVRGETWQYTVSDLFGLPDLVLTFLYWMVTWAAAGFVLGALWRRLPGRRGAAKALPIALAFALPVGLRALGNRFTQESNANLALYVVAMLFVLTITGIALDLDTFRSERRYWQSRLGLLLSVYQMRYYSLQMAYLIAQVVAMITIWQFFAEPDVMPPDERTGAR
ncbi:hypothetical protein HW130_28210 [Streptomyces sp. PKU-EA00015]|uniref:DUF6185 family protein n=1 Tax=Streptomyces sp. PKU-EA00015 TaxID=2748326 RepID=UPI0015A0EABB|nr:DUF6185 family protein [Streptomyces sp. PKU-EA00015]NWF30096.1 hypothetical protein [Streptomyces sp. PKU-EA00015]